jgi:hypothetical protein
MASHLNRSGKNESGEFAKFKDFMGRLVAVPLSEVKQLEKKQRAKRKPKRHSASRAANGKS